MEKSLNRTITGEENGNILHIAYNIINGDRQKDYGEPWDNFGLLAEFFTSYAKKRWGDKGIVFKRTDVVNFLELLKLSRACTAQPTQDTYVDIAGYAGLGGDFAERQYKESPVCVPAVEPAESVLSGRMGKRDRTTSGRVSTVPLSAVVTVGSKDEWNTEDDLHG